MLLEELYNSHYAAHLGVLQNDHSPLAMGLVAFLGLGCMQVCEWIYHLPTNQGCHSAIVGVAPTSSSSLG